MTKKIYLQTLKSALGRSIYHYLSSECWNVVIVHDVFKTKRKRYFKSKQGKEFYAIIFQFNLIIFYINILFCLLPFDEITNLVVQNEFNVSNIYFHPINSNVGFFKQ